ncbi:DUF1361 domain-containing protein [Runella sp.]|uniref:DUF1361 domain-containing protein n=1 Tax=Runella sp. TaxID=1960881 RepID=UPI00260BAF3D|nr:DUF1361 domain-containing protein [Runella sp.]
MLKRLIHRFRRYRFMVYEPPIITLEGLYPLLLLLLLSLVATTYHTVRIQFKEAVDFSLDWNLFLSWIPLLVAYMVDLTVTRFGKLPKWVGFWSVVWMVFFPNAPYMITDLVHLSGDMGRDLTWHDMIMLFFYAEVSLINGLVSVYWMHRSWQKTYTKIVSNVLLAISFPLAGFGIYLGRIRRWNSWDIVENPEKLLRAIGQSLTDRTALVLSLEFGVLLSMLYLVLWVLLRFRVRPVE